MLNKLIWFNGTSNIDGYLLLIPVYTYILDIKFLNEFFAGNFIFKQVRAHLFAHS